MKKEDKMVRMENFMTVGWIRGWGVSTLSARHNPRGFKYNSTERTTGMLHRPMHKVEDDALRS